MAKLDIDELPVPLQRLTPSACAQRCNSLTLAQDITEQNGVSAVPTVIVFHKGKRTEHMFMGNQPPAQLAEFIEKVSKL